PGHLALVVGSAARCWLPWGFSKPNVAREALEHQRRLERMRYHLGRGRRAREAGRYGRGAVEARRALEQDPGSAWALALLGECLYRQPDRDLNGARRALERARALEPTNGYFVGLLLKVLDAQGDAQARADTLSRA